MSLPPQILRIKRKVDDATVDALYIEQREAKREKRHCAPSDEAYVYRRLLPQAASSAEISSYDGLSSPVTRSRSPLTVHDSSLVPTTTNGIPQIMASQPGDENMLPAHHPRHILPARLPAHAPNHGQAVAPGRSGTVRRYVLSNVSNLVAASSALIAEKRGRNHENGKPVALFVEEPAVKRAKPEVVTQELHISDESTHPDAMETQYASKELVQPVRKRPGRSAAVKKTATTAAPRTISSVDDGASGIMLQDALQQFALEEIGTGSNYERSGQDKTAMAIDNAPQHQAQNEDDEMESAEYTYDTFVRQPIGTNERTARGSSSMDTYAGNLVAGPTTSIGYLVIPEESSSVFFLPDSDAEDEVGDFDSDADDENNENYYAADYPEEEARDDDGEAYSDDEFNGDWDFDEEGIWERNKRQWGWKDGRMRSAKAFGDESGDEDEDEDGGVDEAGDLDEDEEMEMEMTRG